MHVLTVNYSDQNAPQLFCQSLRETGFAVLTSHPVSPGLIKLVYTQWELFFNSEYKHQYQHKKSSQNGYFPFRTENAKDNNISDLKEFYHFYPWGEHPSNLTEITTMMFEVLNQLAGQLLQWIESGLPLEVAATLTVPLKQMIHGSRNTLLRILHYPPMRDGFEAHAVRAAAHEDINLITLLPAATAPGLEVLDRSGQWHAVACDPGNIVVNVGDMLQMCTNNYFRSTKHRVVNPLTETENRSRFSMPLFLHPREEVRLAKNFTAGEYLSERLRQIGIY
ncbi:MAG: 2OG-Fe(II) oxygenase [Gammaproteobacteria bacterium RIFCSPHIGHO2_12_FULL_43_28]|nr:MAG: 2OG-Fe(II) oxygenase [Gammaproteobacteria bacterium RIFCSPHIGHO2_12_FULL_43_28]